jgi:hypothetical protein
MRTVGREQRTKMNHVLKLGLAAMLLPIAPLCATQPADTAASEASILECGMLEFTEADDRLFGQVYGLPRNRSLRSDPDGRLRVRDREEEQIAICGRQYHLSGGDLDLVDTYTRGEMLRRGAARHLRQAGADSAKLDVIAESLSWEDIGHYSNDALLQRLHIVLDEAGIPKPLHAAAVDYMVFVKRGAAFRMGWARQRTGRH